MLNHFVNVSFIFEWKNEHDKCLHIYINNIHMDNVRVYFEAFLSVLFGIYCFCNLWSMDCRTHLIIYINELLNWLEPLKFMAY